MSRQPFRLEPQMPANAYRTFQVVAPRPTHWRSATCAEADCAAYANGWVTDVDESIGLGQRQAHYVRRESGRRYTEQRLESGLIRFTFEAGQTCFAAGGHQVRVDRPEIYIARDGDWRGNPTGRTRTHSRAADWVDDFGEHQLRLADQQKRG